MTHQRYMFDYIRLNELIISQVTFRNCRLHFCVLTTFLETAVNECQIKHLLVGWVLVPAEFVICWFT